MGNYGTLRPIRKNGTSHYTKHSSFLLLLFTLPQCRIYNPDASESGEHRLWIRTLDRYTNVGLPESVVSRISGPPPDNTGQNTDEGFTPSPRIEIKILHSAENRTRVVRLEGRDSTNTTARTTIQDLNWLITTLSIKLEKTYSTFQFLCL